MATADHWRKAFAEQAASDLLARDTLARSHRLPPCHQLHYLQMACEKLVKAHLFTETSQPANLLTSHAVIKKHLPGIIEDQFRRATRRKAPPRMRQAFKQIAGEVELLAPALQHDGTRPDNCEYPWETGAGELRLPATHPFPVRDLLERPAGILFLKLLRAALGDLL